MITLEINLLLAYFIHIFYEPNILLRLNLGTSIVFVSTQEKAPKNSMWEEQIDDPLTHYIASVIAK